MQLSHKWCIFLWRMSKSCKGMQQCSVTALLFPLLEIPAVVGMNSNTLEWLLRWHFCNNKHRRWGNDPAIGQVSVWAKVQLLGRGFSCGRGQHLWWEFSRNASLGSCHFRRWSSIITFQFAIQAPLSSLFFNTEVSYSPWMCKISDLLATRPIGKWLIICNTD